MGRLTSRGWAAKTPKITTAEANAFMRRCQESHTAEWKCDITRWRSGTNHVLATDVPVVGGQLTIDSSDPIRRRVSLELGVGDEWVPYDEDSPLVPWGQWVTLFVRVDYTGGTGNSWSPWLKLFEGPIQSNVYERPSKINTIEATDASQTVDDFAYLRKRSYNKDRTLKSVLKEIVDDALPGALYGVDASTKSDTTNLGKAFHAEAGESRLEAANRLAGKHGQEIFFSGLGDLVIRKDITDEDDDNWDSSEPGPDIGKVSDPICIFKDGPGGNLIGMTTSLTREGAVNAVQVNLTATVNRRKKGQKKATSKELWYSAFEPATGTIGFNDSFGRLPYVETKSVDKMTAGKKDAADRRAKRLLQRRRGLLKYHDLDVLPQYWADVDDKVRIIFDGTQEHHYIQSLTIPLDGGPMRVRTRTLSVKDPGTPPEPVPDEWLTLPDIVRVMAPAGYTTPLGVNGWSAGGSEMSLHSQRLHIYSVNGPVFNPVESFKIPEAWDCGYQHIYVGDEGSPYWNVPTNNASWSGSAMCEPLHGAVVIGANATSGINGASCRASTSASGSQDALRLECRQTAFWISLSQIKTSRFGNLSSPSGGLPNPTPPPGYTLVWENPTSTLSKIEAAIAEPSTNTNNGVVYMVKCNPGSGGYGPVDPTGASLNWTIGNATPGGTVVPGYSGGEGEWREVTNLINETGKTWFLFVSKFIHDRAGVGTGVHPFDVRETRLDLRGAFRFSVSPSRYKFVKT